ncbi:PAS domain-containing protein [Catenulispora yoronensis]|uniref:PAS domain-containing protein n=1 Tax=Catenulispora yoronensis TaxID=450799 RepID=UPI0031D8BD6E
MAAILDSLPEALLLIDAGGRVVNANAVAVGWFEAPGNPLVGRSVTDLLSGFGTALARVAGGADAGAGVWTEPGDGGAGSAGGPEEAGVPTRMVAKLPDGTGFPAEVVRSFLPAVHGGLEVVVVRDVSRVADAEQELRRQQRQTELILRAASEGIVGVDTAGRVVLVNPAAARILKYRASELGGLEFDALLGGVAPGEPSPVADTLRTGRKHRLGSEAGLQLTAKGGAAVPVELSTAPVLEGETLVGAVVTFVDLARFRFPALPAPTPAAPAEGGISPEAVGALRRPLDAARNELARLATSGDVLTPSARHQLAHVTAELAEASRLVDDLLDVAAGPAGLRKRPAELGRIVHAATDAATDLAGAAGIDLAVHTGPAEVVIDAERMTQAVRHLLVDTVQASPRGSTVVVAAARRGPIARIEVRGAEIGGVPEHLGFARGVVERHGGQLTVHRVDGKGVTYVIELPVGPEGATELASGAPSASRNLVEETRIIPVVREIEPPEPAGSTHSGRRRMDSGSLEPVGQPGVQSGLRPGGQSGMQSGMQAGVQSGAQSGAQSGMSGMQSGMQSGSSAVATTTTIPRQVAPSAENGWFDGVRGYAPQTDTSPTGATQTQTPATDGTPAVEPRGRRRAAHHQGGDNYLIQHVEPATGYEPDAPLRTSGSYQEEAALATSGNFTPEAQQASSLYGDNQLQNPAPAPFGTDDGLPLFRDEVQPLGTHATGARHGVEPQSNAPAQSSAHGKHGGSFGTESPSGDGQHGGTFAGGFGSEGQNGVVAQAGNAGMFAGGYGGERQNNASAQAGTPGAFTGGYGAEMQNNASAQPGAFAGGYGGEGQNNASTQAGATGPFGSGYGGGEPQNSASPQAGPPGAFAGGYGAEPQNGSAASAFGLEAQRPPLFPGGFAADAQPSSSVGPFGADAQGSAPFPGGVGQSGAAPSPFGADLQSPAPAPFASGFGGGLQPAAQFPGGFVPESSNSVPAAPPSSGFGGAFTEPQPPSPFGTQAPPFMADQQAASPFAAEAQPPAPFMTEPQRPALPASGPASDANAWPNPAQPDPQPAMAAWPPTDVAEPTTPPTLLVWPAPEPSAEQLLVQHGYAPTALKSPAQLQETGVTRPVALIADPVGVPVTRAALHTLRAAAADSGIPLFVTAGLGAVPAASVAATARRGADPSALLRALTPEQVASPRVLLLEENPDLAAAFAISLERDGMRVVQSATENDAMSALSAEHPQLVVMNLTLIRRRRSGVVEWLRAYERLHLAPTVLYTVPAGMASDVDLVHALRSGAAAVHLTDREVGPEAANRLLDLMGKVSD